MNDRDVLIHRIDDLRAFERDYRARLIAYLEDQLGELRGADATSALTTAVLRITAAADSELADALTGLPPRHVDRLLAVLLRTPVGEMTP